MDEKKRDFVSVCPLTPVTVLTKVVKPRSSQLDRGRTQHYDQCLLCARRLLVCDCQDYSGHEYSVTDYYAGTVSGI